jgi:hypothetical protein
MRIVVLLNYIKDAPPNLDIKDKFQIQSIVLSGQYNPNEIPEIVRSHQAHADISYFESAILRFVGKLIVSFVFK